MFEGRGLPEVPSLATIDEFPRMMMNPSGASAELVRQLEEAIEGRS